MTKREINYFDVEEIIMMSDLLPSAGQKLIALRILKYDTRQSGKVVISQRWLANAMNMSHSRTIRRTISVLEKHGLVKRDVPNKRDDLTRLEINWYGLRVLAKNWDPKKCEWSEEGRALLSAGASLLSADTPRGVDTRDTKGRITVDPLSLQRTNKVYDAVSAKPVVSDFDYEEYDAEE